MASRAYALRRKREIINHYSTGKEACALCGFDDIRALSIDHINGGGCQHRCSIRVSAGNNFYRWLKNNNFPVGYQVLCMNCQAIKRVVNNENSR